jgi:branched-chain amino acid aminotransferase
MPAVCNINGVVLPESEATIPVLDRGFLFGDSVYEVMRTRDHVPFAWPEHLERMRHSAAGIGLDLELDDRQLMRRVLDTLTASECDEAYIRLITTRGTGTAPNIGLQYAPGPATHLVLVRPLEVGHDPARLAIIPRLRNDRRALDPGIKSGNYLNNLLGLAEAVDRGATDCLFLNQSGVVTEASTSNFYMVTAAGTVLTPPATAGLLRGITRRLLFELCAEIGVPLEERDVTADEVRGAAELFLSSTLRNVVPVVELDGEPVGDGDAGPVTRRLVAAFEDYCDRLVRERYRPALADV